MAGSSTERAVGRAANAPSTVLLVNWPLRDDGAWGWLMLMLFAAIAVGAGHISHSTPMAYVVFAALVISAWRLWLPTRFELGSKGVIQSVLGRRRRIVWAEFARYEIRRNGVLLLADKEKSSLVVFRGLYVRWRDQREALLEVVDFFINARSVLPTSTTRTYQERQGSE